MSKAQSSVASNPQNQQNRIGTVKYGGGNYMPNGENKAHTATANRIASVYGSSYNSGDGFDIQTNELTIEVETTATVLNAIERLEQHPGRVFVALTNKDGVKEAIRLTKNSRVGVMDAKGNIVRDSSDAAVA